MFPNELTRSQKIAVAAGVTALVALIGFTIFLMIRFPVSDEPVPLFLVRVGRSRRRRRLCPSVRICDPIFTDDNLGNDARCRFGGWNGW